MKAVVVGSGGWGTALAMLLVENGHDVTLWSYQAEESRHLAETGENPLLPGVKLPQGLTYTSDLACVTGCAVVVMATPSFGVRSTAGQVKDLLAPDAILVSVSKGIEKGTSLRMTQIIREVTEDKWPVVALSGPSHAEEVARQVPTAVVSACPDQTAAEVVQDLFINDHFRVYSSSDVIGVELGAALKNVMALCTGCCTGMGLGDNTKAMLMTRGLAETARLGTALGGRPETFAGLAGVGDLITTCTSVHSRNHQAGILIGGGMKPAEAIEKVGAVVEGYYAAATGMELAERMGIEMPITQAIYSVMYEDACVYSVSEGMMGRAKTHEANANW